MSPEELEDLAAAERPDIDGAVAPGSSGQNGNGLAPTFPVVGIGASAGGLEALERFFRSVAPECGMAFVIVQHLSPDFKSLMDELLARHTSLPIHPAEDGMKVEPNSVYLLPPRKEMIISSGRLLLTDKDPERDLSLPIDHFFRSLAQDAGRRAIAVILSGTGSDGSRGIRDIHEAGGLVVVQLEESAQFDGMPKSARETGLADYLLPPEEMPSALQDYVLHLVDVDPDAESSATGFDAAFKLLRSEYGIDFSYYKPNTVARRIQRRQTLIHAADINEYLQLLRNDSEELNSLYRDLLIGVTRFFRDREAFERLERDVLPDLIARKRPNEELRIWIPGCATGEEAYSIAMLVDERRRLLGRPLNVKIFATDVHRASLEHASAGVYSEETLSEVTPARLERYFTKSGDGIQVTAELRQMIVFAVQNLIKDAPFTKLDLISCRNLLIYFQPPAQKKVLSLFHFGLRTGGVMFLGPSESPGELSPEFEDLDQHWKLYRKRRDIRLPPDMRLPVAATTMPMRVGQPSQKGGIEGTLAAAYDRLLERHMPPGLLITERRHLSHTFGNASRWLRFPGGRASNDILDLVDEELKLPLAGGLQRAAKEQKPVVYSSVRMKTAEGDQQLKLTVEPILNRHSHLTHYFISLEPQGAPQPAPPEPTSINVEQSSRDFVKSLEAELHYTRENLQAVVEELETSNEEMQASNEELVASNEELQSTNEELHSVNEELYTVNAEYQRKISELTELTDDMDNLLRSTEIGTLFLDRSLCIRKFTPQIGRVFNLLPQDIGRRIDNFSHTIRNIKLLEDVVEVLQGGGRVEKEVQNREGDWFLLRILPYRSHAQMQGVVLSLIDIAQLKRAQLQVAQMSAIVSSSRDAIIGMDLEGSITSWNRGAEQLLGYPAEEAIGKTLAICEPAITEGGADQASWQEAIVQVQRGLSVDYNIETGCRRKDGSLIELWLGFSPIHDRDGVCGLSVIARDISERKRNEREAQEGMERRDRFLAMLSHELRNPLSAVLNAERVLDCEGIDDTMRREALGAIARQSRQMARLLDDLLDVSRITRNRIEIRKETVDLRETSRAALDVIRPQAAARDLNLNVELPEIPLWVEGDPVRLQQIQVNLLTNCVKYTPSGGEISFSANRADGIVELTFKDNGVGIPPAMQDRIFDLFVQLDQETGKGQGGMGVGLTLVRTLVNLHGGSVRVHSDGAGKGSLFKVSLPLAKETNPTSARDGSIGSLAGLRVLLVEDQPDLRATTVRLLQLYGADVIGVEDGLRAIHEAQRQQFDFALIDIGMPGMDGYEVARRLRQTSASRQLPLVALTGFGQPEDRSKAREAGFDGHLVKPIDLEALSEIVRGML